MPYESQAPGSCTAKVLGGAGGLRQPFHPPAKHTHFSSPTCLHNPGNTIGLCYYSSYRFACARIHVFKLSGLLLVTWKSKVSHQKKKEKKRKVLFRIPAPYILISNLALKSPEDDHILLLPPIEEYFSTSRGNVS